MKCFGVVLAVALLACGDPSTPSASAAADAAPDVATYECCVEGHECATGRKIRWCASPDAGPAGARCVLSDEEGCYARATDAGTEKFSTTSIAPRETWPEGVVECAAADRTSCP